MSSALLIAAALDAGTILALASLGLLINEKAGILNLGAEGMMLCAALAGFATVVHTGSAVAGFAAGMVVGGLLAGCFGVLVIWLGTNQYATGLALSLFGAGLSAFAGTAYVQEKLPEALHFKVPFLGDLPFVGPAFFNQHPVVYLAIAITLGLMFFLFRTRAGLVLRSVGESPESAHALGYNVRLIRLGAVVAGRGAVWFGGRLCGYGVYPVVGRRHDRGQGLDCPGVDHVCDLASYVGAAWRLFIWRGDHVAISLARHGRAHFQPVFEYAALPSHHFGVGADFA